MDAEVPSSEEIALNYLEQLPWEPYPFQEQAILAWFEGEDGILVCAPTGTGKTVIAETALYEALVTGRRAYYTTPLIALTEQKFHELQAAAERWGFSPDDVGLVTGNRRVNSDAPVLVVVAEILLNRLLTPEEFSFGDVSAVVMDEFHSFNDPERGIVWELSLGLLPNSTRLLLISATVGNAPEFVAWLSQQHRRRLRLLQSEERRVPLDFRWIPDQLLSEQLEIMAEGREEERYTPGLVFCFNRSECWSVAEQLRGKRLLADGQQKKLQQELEKHDWSVGAGGKLKQILIRGVGVHHAGILPRYRRVVEQIFQKKLLSICVCTETLAAGINLPARSVVMISLLKGPHGKQKLVDASSAHQMFGRAGRPQFDSRGYVFAVAHEDDVKIHRWQEKYDAIRDDSKDPLVLRAKKKLKKKMPRRREGQQYWSEKQFVRLRHASPAKLASKGRFPWRLLAFLIRKSGNVRDLLAAIQRRLLSPTEKEGAVRRLRQMLLTLESAGFITLEPPPDTSTDDGIRFEVTAAGTTAPLIGSIPPGSQSIWLSRGDSVDDLADADVSRDESENVAGFGAGVFEAPVNSSDVDPDSPQASDDIDREQNSVTTDSEDLDHEPAAGLGLLGQLLTEARTSGGVASSREQPLDHSQPGGESTVGPSGPVDSEYEPEYAIATESLDLLFNFRSINSIFGIFLADSFYRASHEERLLLLEGALDMPRSVASKVRVPFPEHMPPGPMATGWLTPQLLSRGLATQEEITGYRDEDTGRRIPPLDLIIQMQMLFRAEFPAASDARCSAVWCVGDLLTFGGDFNKYVRARDLTKQEGIVFRHCLRMILLCGEFATIQPPQIDPGAWQRDLAELVSQLTDSCRAVDPSSTDETLTTLELHQQETEISL